MESSVFQQLLSYLLNGEEELPKTEAERRKLRRMAPSFIVKDRRLFYIGPSMQYMRLVVLTPEEKTSVLTKCHCNPANGQHYGARITQNRVIAGYYWNTLIADVKEWYRSCHHCQQKKTIKTAPPPSRPPQPPVHPPQLKEPWELLGLDLIGPLPETSRGNIYVLTMSDFRTKWVIAEPLKTISVAEVSAVITSKILTFGMAEEIIMHQGKEFVNQLNDSIFSKLKIKHAVKSVPRPKAKEHAVITNHNIKRALRKCVNCNPDDWDLHLSAVAYGINITKQYSTRHTPYFLLFQRHPRLPAVINACHGGDEVTFTTESNQQPVQNPIQITSDHLSEPVATRNSKKKPQETPSLDSSQLVQKTKPLLVHNIDHPYALPSSHDILGPKLNKTSEKVQSLERKRKNANTRAGIKTPHPTSSGPSPTI
uniref:Integrase catalytic domain-containing protein n=1 Tax=Gouania willdenowi TaxID=441366 RepID=A0A8C5DIV6_GOUWI